MDHIAAEQRSNEESCRACASVAGYPAEEADACEDGALRCVGCPFVPKYVCAVGGKLPHPERKCPQAIKSATHVSCTYQFNCQHKSAP